jgi:hypothetical protein
MRSRAKIGKSRPGPPRRGEASSDPFINCPAALGQGGLEVFSARIAGTINERPNLLLGPIARAYARCRVRDAITAAPAHNLPRPGPEEVFPRHRGEGRLDPGCVISPGAASISARRSSSTILSRSRCASLTSGSTCPPGPASVSPSITTRCAATRGAEIKITFSRDQVDVPILNGWIEKGPNGWGRDVW